MGRYRPAKAASSQRYLHSTLRRNKVPEPEYPDPKLAPPFRKIVLQENVCEEAVHRKRGKSAPPTPKPKRRRVDASAGLRPIRELLQPSQPVTLPPVPPLPIPKLPPPPPLPIPKRQEEISVVERPITSEELDSAPEGATPKKKRTNSTDGAPEGASPKWGQNDWTGDQKRRFSDSFMVFDIAAPEFWTHVSMATDKSPDSCKAFYNTGAKRLIGGITSKRRSLAPSGKIQPLPKSDCGLHMKRTRQHLKENNKENSAKQTIECFPTSQNTPLKRDITFLNDIESAPLEDVPIAYSPLPLSQPLSEPDDFVPPERHFQFMHRRRSISQKRETDITYTRRRENNAKSSQAENPLFDIMAHTRREIDRLMKEREKRNEDLNQEGVSCRSMDDENMFSP